MSQHQERGRDAQHRSTMSSPDAHAVSLRRPVVADGLIALQRILPGRAQTSWIHVLAVAGLGGNETDPASLRRLIQTLRCHGPVLRMCGRSLEIRAKTADRLLATAVRHGPAPDLAGPDLDASDGAAQCAALRIPRAGPVHAEAQPG